MAHFVLVATFWFGIAFAGAENSGPIGGASTSSSQSSAGTGSGGNSEASFAMGGGGSRKCAPPPARISSTSLARRSITVFPNKPLLAPAVRAKHFENMKV